MMGIDLKVFGAIFARGFSSLAELAFVFFVVLLSSPAFSDSFFLYLAILVVFTTIARSGPDILVNRKLPVMLVRGEYQDIYALLKYAYLHVFALGVALVALYLVVIFIFDFNGSSYLNYVLVVGGCLPMALTYLNSEILKGLGRPLSSQLFYGGVTYLISIVLLAWFWQIHVQSGEYVAYIFLAANGIACLVSFVYVFRLDVLNLRSLWRSELNNRVFRNAGGVMRLSFIRPLSILMIWLPSFMLSQFGNAGEISAYTVAVRVSLAISLVLFAIEGYSSPAFANFHAARDFSGLKSFFLRMQLVCICVTVPIGLLLIFAADYILSYTGLSDVKNSYSVVCVMIAAQVLNSLTGPVVALLLMSEKQVILQRIQISVAVLSLVVFVYLVPVYGAMGAALGSFLMIVSMNVLFLLVAHLRVFAPSS